MTKKTRSKKGSASRTREQKGNQLPSEGEKTSQYEINSSPSKTLEKEPVRTHKSESSIQVISKIPILAEETEEEMVANFLQLLVPLEKRKELKGLSEWLENLFPTTSKMDGVSLEAQEEILKRLVREIGPKNSQKILAGGLELLKRFQVNAKGTPQEKLIEGSISLFSKHLKTSIEGKPRFEILTLEKEEMNPEFLKKLTQGSSLWKTGVLAFGGTLGALVMGYFLYSFTTHASPIETKNITTPEENPEFSEKRSLTNLQPNSTTGEHKITENKVEFVPRIFKNQIETGPNEISNKVEDISNSINLSVNNSKENEIELKEGIFFTIEKFIITAVLCVSAGLLYFRNKSLTKAKDKSGNKISISSEKKKIEGPDNGDGEILNENKIVEDEDSCDNDKEIDPNFDPKDVIWGYGEFKKKRKLRFLSPWEYYPSPAAKRGRTFQLEDKSESDTQDPTVSLRVDSQPKENETVDEYLTRIYQEYDRNEDNPRGFVFATYDFLHVNPGKHPALQFLENHIKTLKNIGIKKIYLEQLAGISSSEYSYRIHNYFYKNKELPNTSSTLGAIIKLAKSHGIEVIGAEVEIQGYRTGGSSNESRVSNFNQRAAELIRGINEPFVVFAGAAHGKLRRKAIPGLSEYLDCPCIGFVSDSPNLKVQKGTHQFIERHYSVDAVFVEEKNDLD